MKATYLTEQGTPEVLTYGDLPDPQPGPGQVLVRVRAAALNHMDVWIRSGVGRAREFTEPFILGGDVAGEVAALGEGAVGLAVGDRVLIDPGLPDHTCDACLSGRTNLCDAYQLMGLHLNGGYAEFVAVPTTNVHTIPNTLSMEQAAAIPLTTATAYHMLVTRAGLRPGQRVLVQAAGSGVGVAAIQIAKALGAWVVTTAGSDEKVAKGLELGADLGINYRTQPAFSEPVREATDGAGVDIVVDHIGPATFDENLKALKRGGHLVNCGRTTGETTELNLFGLLMSQQTIHGSFMGTQAETVEWMRLVRDGHISGIVGETFPLADAAGAHRRMESRDFFGKLVLVP
jgi:NADPH:quinone reductase-like Zn-dependent oxidoreductase